ncbi:MAG: hypothetical protein QXU24_03600 [Ignisphaera sp.]
MMLGIKVRLWTLLLLVVLFIPTMETYTYFAVAYNNDFQLITYSYKSSAGTDNIYPGSKNVELNVNIQYIAEKDAIVSSACLQLPNGFTVSRGASYCSSPYSPNNTVVSSVKRNDVVIFRYRLDVGPNVSPGSYPITMVVHYYKVNGESIPYTETIEGITILVEMYPEINIDVIDWYWSPEAYPGSQNVYLYIVLKNVGDSTILQANGIANLQYGTFTPSSIRFRVPTLNKYSTATITLGPISITSAADPSVPYTIELVLDATMSTDDNVVYDSSETKTFTITLTTPSPINLEVLDYGFESVKIVENAVQTRFYVTIINKDFKIVRNIVAYYTILSQGANFVNGTKSAVSIYNQVVNYGDTVTLYSRPINIGMVDRTDIELRLVIFGEDNGAEFWCENRYYFTASIDKPHVNLVVADSYWIDREVYPGSENIRFAVILENYDVVDVRDLVATLEFPSNFYPKIVKLTDIDIPKGSRNMLVFPGISINSNVEAGTYRVRLEVNGIAVVDANTFYKFQNSYTLMVTVSTPPNQTILNVVEYGWLSKKAYVNSIGLRLYAYFMVSTPGFSIQNPMFTVYLPKQMVFQSLTRNSTTIVNGVFSYGQTIYVEVPNIDIIAHDEGVYPIVVRVRGLTTGSQSFWYDGTFSLLLPVSNPRLNVTLVDSGWQNDIVSSTTSGATAYLTLQSLNIDTISSLIIQLEFDGINVRFIDGRNRSITTLAGPINYGSTFTAIFTDIEVNGTHINRIVARVSLIGIIQSYGMYYRVKEDYIVELCMLPVLKVFVIGAIHTQYGGVYAPLLPSARSISINIDLVNIKTYSISWMRPKAYYTPHIIRVNDISGTCLYGSAPSGTCSLVLNVDVEPSARPYNYTIVIEVEYGIQRGNAIAIYSDVLEIPIAIASYNYYKSGVRPTTWYWGIQTPVRVLEGQRNVPLTVIVTNGGPHPVNGVEVELEPIDKNVTMLNRRAVCTPVLNVGGSCSTTLYVDLSNVSTDRIEFYVNIYYIFTLYGTNISDRTGYNISLYIDRGASGKGLEIVDWGWLNDWPAYPNTNNATYFITAVNNWPYRVSGVKLVLSLPNGFSSKEGDRVTSYIPGPINSLQQFTATFQINIGDIEPGRYDATLMMEYIVETGTPNTAIIEKHPVKILVNDPSDSISVVSVQWIGATPELGTYGAMLAIAIRNNYNPLIKGAILELHLPKGFTYSATNQSYAKIPATNMNVAEYYTISPIGYQQTIMNYISQIIQQGSIGQSFEYGSLMYFYVKLNVLIDKPGIYPAKAYLNFIDHWNCIRRIPLEIDITVLGSTKIVDITTPIKVKVVNGTSLLSIGIINIGSSPLYNLYIYLVPYTSMLLPHGNIKYIDFLPPNNVVYISYNLVYNPMAIAMGAAQTYMRYMSVPFGITVVYRDASGFMQYFNTSVSILLEPFIDLRLEDVRAIISGGVLRVSGIVVNYGIATARSVEARINVDGELVRTLVGDIDPASQSAFRIEARVERLPNDVTLSIVYRDEYYIENVLERRISFTVETPTTTYIQQGQPLQLNHILVIVAVSLFLLVMALIFYRYMKRVAVQQSVYKG